MTEKQDPHTNFAGTYFNRDSIINFAKTANVFAWITLAIYVAQVLLSITVFLLQIARGLIVLNGPTDYAQQFSYILPGLVPGMQAFVIIQGIGKLLLIIMDIEDNTRRAARK